METSTHHIKYLLSAVHQTDNLPRSPAQDTAHTLKRDTFPSEMFTCFSLFPFLARHKWKFLEKFEHTTPAINIKAHAQEILWCPSFRQSTPHFLGSNCCLLAFFFFFFFFEVEKLDLQEGNDFHREEKIISTRISITTSQDVMQRDNLQAQN